MPGPLDNGAVVAVAVLGAALVADAEVMRRGHRAFCDHARCHPRATVVGLVYIVAHIFGGGLPAPIRALDPLSAAARRLPRRTP